MSERDRGRARDVGGALVIEIRGRFYVASRTTPGLFWRASHDWCDCPNAVFRQAFCRHQKAISELNRQRTREDRAA